MTTKYKIHPAIGIARVGDSDEYYIAPATAGTLPTEYSSSATNVDAFRDKDSKLLKQAARFKVYKYDDQNPDGVEVKIGVDGVSAIEWTSWIASKKASWFQFEQQTGSGQGPYAAGATVDSDSDNPYAFVNDLGYDANNANNPFVNGAADPNRPSNPLRYNLSLGTSKDPATIKDAARQKLILDPGPRKVSGKNQRVDFTLDPGQYPFLSTLVPFPITRLGAALTDGDGNLVVLGGDGNSGTTSHDGPYTTIDAYANNEGWFDDIADGPVSATLIMADCGPVEVEGLAWVVVGPPAYAPQVINQVNMYDNMHDIFVRKLGANPDLYNGNAFVPNYPPSYPDEIVPILSRPTPYQYLCNIPGAGVAAHGGLLNDDPGSFQENIFNYIRGRGDQYANSDGTSPAENQSGLMPFLAGDNPISNDTISKYLGLTETQYFMLSQYANGTYTHHSLPAVGPGVASDLAHLQNCVGGAFSPGIEITWITRNTSIYKPLPPIFDASDFFRINAKPLASLIQYQLSLNNGSDGDYSKGLEPGDLSKYMAQPWQADFNECSIQNISNLELNKPRAATTNYWWWPAQRPYAVYPKDSPAQQVPWTRGFVDDLENDATDQSNNCSDIQMVSCWKYMGFIVANDDPNLGPAFIETSRLTDKIDSFQSFCKLPS